MKTMSSIRIPFRACHHDYRCATCEFDQFFQDQYAVHAVVRSVDFLEVQGFKVPQGYYVHPGHTWMKMEGGNSVRVGIDDFALRLLGPVDTVEAPLLGKEVRQGRGDIHVSRGRHRADLLSPVSGVVTALNPKIREQGRVANQAPFSEGWVMTVHASDLRGDLKSLMVNAETGDFLQSEIGRLYDVIEETAGPLAADGGYLGKDIFGSMPELGWDRLRHLFFRSL
jgi:glycine cleavage system H lipoate-binding protein